MKWFIPTFLISIFILSFTIGTVTAWYETDESNQEKNNVYMNSDWNDDQDFFKYKIGDFFTNADIYILNLEPGYYLAYNAELPALIKYDAYGAIQWLEISDLGNNHANEKGLAIDDDYDIYIATLSGVLKIDGTDGTVIWTFDDMLGYDSIIEVEISCDSGKILAYGSNGYTIILNSNDGAIIKGPVDIDNVNEWCWLYDNHIVNVDTSGYNIYNSDLTLHFEAASSNNYNKLYVNHVQTQNGFTTNNSDYIFVTTGGQIKCDLWSNNTFTPLWDYNDGTYGDIVTNIVHNEFANHVYYGMADGLPASASPLRIVCLNFDETNDYLNDSVVWTSAEITGTSLTMGRIIVDHEGDLIVGRYGKTSLTMLYNTTGLVDQTMTTDYSFHNAIIYDRVDSKLITVQYASGNGTFFLVYYTLNGTHVQGTNGHTVIIPEELNEETWDWILFTILIVSISAIGAATAFNGFNQTAFLCFLNINIFIGCWYNIYPIELIVLPMAILAVVIFRTAGDITE